MQDKSNAESTYTSTHGQRECTVPVRAVDSAREKHCTKFNMRARDYTSAIYSYSEKLK